MDVRFSLKDGTVFDGISFGAQTAAAGEAVFSTGMVGYPEAMTDPSYKGQLLITTYPLIGNYGVPPEKLWESNRIQTSGIIVSTYNSTPSHYDCERTLAQWLKDENIPGIMIKDTRLLAKTLRDKGSMLAKITFGTDIDWYDPNADNLVAQVSINEVKLIKTEVKTRKTKTVVYIDCGGKRNMITCLLNRGANVIMVPWNYNPFVPAHHEALLSLLQEHKLPKKIDGLVVSNGPGDPKVAEQAIQATKDGMHAKVPILGICLGHQLLCLAGGGNTTKLKFGHRSQNQPCIMEGTGRCYITTQNHGFAVSELPSGFKTWFTNANDGSNEGIIHTKHPFMSVQFHPEATPGPVDTEWIFDYFLERVNA